jgi:hypothetical protein
MSRVLRPGGELRGTTLLRNAGLRQEALARVMQTAGVFGPGVTRSALEFALDAAGLEEVSVRRDGALGYFSAHRPA